MKSPALRQGGGAGAVIIKGRWNTRGAYGGTGVIKRRGRRSTHKAYRGAGATGRRGGKVLARSMEGQTILSAASGRALAGFNKIDKIVGGTTLAGFTTLGKTGLESGASFGGYTTLAKTGAGGDGRFTGFATLGNPSAGSGTILAGCTVSWGASTVRGNRSELAKWRSTAAMVAAMVVSIVRSVKGGAVAQKVE